METGAVGEQDVFARAIARNAATARRRKQAIKNDGGTAPEPKPQATAKISPPNLLRVLMETNGIEHQGLSCGEGDG